MNQTEAQHIGILIGAGEGPKLADALAAIRLARSQNFEALQQYIDEHPKPQELATVLAILAAEYQGTLALTDDEMLSLIAYARNPTP